MVECHKGTVSAMEILCEDCENYIYDEESDRDICLIDLDMDDYEQFLLSQHTRCPYYRVRDDYRIVRKQN